MARYIDADWITQKLEGWQDKLAETYGWNDEYVLCLGEVLMKIDDTPTADVFERKVGKWIYKGARGRFPVCECSVCGNTENADWAILGDNTNYCPNCGAMMKGEDDAEVH